MKGDTEKDRVLAEARTTVVRDYLTQNFKFDDNRLKTIGVGKTSEADDSSRVEIIVYPVGSEVTPAQSKPSATQ